jgi:hypothetical protein
VTIFIGGGAAKYTAGDFAANSVPWGPAWTAGAMVQAADFFGIDLSYEGNRIELSGPVTDATGEHAARWKHGVDLMLKFGGPVGDVAYPWLGVGFGVTWIVPAGPHFGTRPSATLAEVPLGVGIDLRSSSFLAGARFIYRFLIDDFIVNNPGNNNGGSLDLELVLGLRF